MTVRLQAELAEVKA